MQNYLDQLIKSRSNIIHFIIIIFSFKFFKILLLFFTKLKINSKINLIFRIKLMNFC